MDDLSLRPVLLVEDEALVALVAEENLLGLGFGSISVRTAKDALEVITHGPAPALAMIDVGLPDMPGDELARRMRALAPALPIIMASGYDGAELVEKFAADSLVRVMPKPYFEADLQRAIAELGL